MNIILGIHIQHFRLCLRVTIPQ